MNDLEKTLIEELKRICEPLGLSVVELAVKRGKNGLSIQAVIYRDSGVSIRDCEKVSTLFNGRLAVLGQLEDDNYSLQVSSPGLSREFKDKQEYSLFLLRPVRIILTEPLGSAGGTTVLEGKLEQFVDDTVVIDAGGRLHRIPLSRIKKTKLNG
jgi:ribosome maturation factor RimP